MTKDTDLMTVAQMAARLANPEADYNEEFHQRQIRGWVQALLIDPVRYQGHGRTAAALFGEPQLLQARLFFVMTLMGLKPQQMAQAKRCFGNSEAPKGHKGPFRWDNGLVSLAKRLRAGERWHLVLHLQMDGQIMGGFSQEPEFDNPVVEGLKLCSLVFDCRELFRDLLLLDQGAEE